MRRLVYSEEEEAEECTRGAAVGVVAEEAQDAGRETTADESPAVVIDSLAAPPGPTNPAEAAHELFGVDEMTTGAHTGGSERAESVQDVRHAQVQAEGGGGVGGVSRVSWYLSVLGGACSERVKRRCDERRQGGAAATGLRGQASNGCVQLVNSMPFAVRVFLMRLDRHRQPSRC